MTGARSPQSTRSHVHALRRFGAGLGPMPNALVTPQGFEATNYWSYEFPYNDPDLLEIWCYTDRCSYGPGDQIAIHVHTTGRQYSIEIVRDGHQPQIVHRADGLPGRRQATPADCSIKGCGWTVTHTVRIPEQWRSGCYLVIARTENESGERRQGEHFFVLRASEPGAQAPLALVLTTSTMIAYNNWGGMSSYGGLGEDPSQRIHQPVLSIHRPIARGQLVKPVGAPRASNSYTPPPFWEERYECYEWALAHGYGFWHASAGWATYERPFVQWAERSGYALEYLTQHDLHYRPELLGHYRCLVIVGHDEYWSWEMRDAIDRFVDQGGSIARFAGNFFWQVRLEDDGGTQVCYKTRCDDDPVLGTDRQHLLTSSWEDPRIGRPGTQSLGLAGLTGIYHRYGAKMPRGSGGFTIYRPEHWAFAGTGLSYGDQLGSEAVGVVGFEVDGVDYQFHRGLPYPTHADGAPQSLEILAMAPAMLDVDEQSIVAMLYDGDPPEHLKDRKYGAGMIAAFRRGKGTVFNAGSAEWVRGLIQNDHAVGRITTNVLDRGILEPSG
jgi:hypothetical protein